MADVNHPNTPLTASGTLTYTKTPHHPTLGLTASGTVAYTKTPHHPTLSLDATATIDYTVTPPGYSVTGLCEIFVSTGGEMTIFVTPTTPPEGIDPKVFAVTTETSLPFQLDRFGKPV